MFAIALAAGVARLLTEDTIYTLKLRRRGIDVKSRPAASPLAGLHVADAMQPLPAAVPSAQPIRGVIERFVRDGLEAVPVVDGENRYRGTLVLAELERRMREGALDATAGELAVELPTVPSDGALEAAIDALSHAGRIGLPVVDGGDAVVGWLTQRDVLRAYSTRTSRGRASSGTRRPGHPTR
jgi:CIC family chloride channel protein